MVVRLRLTDGRSVFTELDLGADQGDPLTVLKGILETHPTGWLGASASASLKGTPRLVSIAQVVTAVIEE